MPSSCPVSSPGPPAPADGGDPVSREAEPWMHPGPPAIRGGTCRGCGAGGEHSVPLPDFQGRAGIQEEVDDSCISLIAVARH